ncbi:MAG: lactate utilization protein C [Syntrophus sp. (in: bacteria)]|nr:lactate utilization protein C [Syntrophus sp. (in: bacteria)]
MDSQIEIVLSALQARHIHGFYADDCPEANRKILSLIPSDATVGIGDSTSMRQLGILNLLRERGTRILNPFDPKREDMDAEEYRQARERLRKETTLCDVFLTGTNALTQDGRLVNVDAVGNRVAGMFWGHPLSIVIAGRNKIVNDLDEAFHRIRNIIAPTHFQIRAALGGRKRETPCVVTGECSDCRTKDRGCNIFTVIESKPSQTDLNIILVNQDLGLGWDPSWPQERIAEIRANYKKLVSLPV